MKHNWPLQWTLMSLMFALATPASVRSEDDKKLVEYKGKCNVRIHWKIENQVNCDVHMPEVDVPEFCSKLFATGNEIQCLITTKSRLTHEILGQAVRSCLRQLSRSCF